MTQHPSARWLLDPGHFLALGAGTGLAPAAPGTCGTLVGVVLYVPLAACLDQTAYCGIVAAAFIAGIPLCSRSAARLGIHDHPAIVWDEIVGYLATMAFATASWASIGVGFLLFRLFDIWKPWPIRLLDRRLGGGLGIMADDLAAAIFAGIGLELFEYLSYS
jgi:phosphatidylglycerophosphatase A